LHRSRAKAVKPTLRRFKYLNFFSRFADTAVSRNFFLKLVPSNAQLLLNSNPRLLRTVYQTASVHKKLGRFFYPKRFSYQFFSSVLHCAFAWRNTFLIVTSLGLEFRRTRFHYRFFKLFAGFLRYFLSVRLGVLNFVIRVRGCFGKIARTRSIFLRPLSRYHIPLSIRSLTYPVSFSFRHVVTKRGVFSLAVWLV